MNLNRHFRSRGLARLTKRFNPLNCTNTLNVRNQTWTSLRSKLIFRCLEPSSK